MFVTSAPHAQLWLLQFLVRGKNLLVTPGLQSISGQVGPAEHGRLPFQLNWLIRFEETVICENPNAIVGLVSEGKRTFTE